MKAGSALNFLFGSGGGIQDDDGDDPLVYKKTKDGSASSSSRQRSGTQTSVSAAPVSTAAATSVSAQSQGGQRNDFMLVTSVQALYLYDTATKSYQQRGSGVVGCVIVGQNASYKLMFYNQARETLALLPIDSTLTAQLQPNGQGKYMLLSSSQGTYSVLCGAPAATCELLRNIYATAAHVAMHEGGGGAADLRPSTVEAAVTPADQPKPRAAGPGDAVSTRFTVYSLTTIPSARPSDVLKSPPLVAQASRTVVVPADGTGARGLAKATAGVRVGDRRLALATLTELLATGDIDPASMSGASAFGLAGGAAGARAGTYVLLDVSVVGVEQAPAPAPAPVAAPVQPQASGSRQPRLPSLSFAGPGGQLGSSPPPSMEAGAQGFGATGDDIGAEGGRSRAGSTASVGNGLRDRMARLSVAAGSGGANTRAGPAVLTAGPGGQLTVDRARAASGYTESGLSLDGSISADGTTASRERQTSTLGPGAAVAPGLATGLGTSINPVTGLPLGVAGSVANTAAGAQAGLMSGLGTSMGMQQAQAQAQAMAALGGMGGMGMGMLPLLLQAAQGGAMGTGHAPALQFTLDSLQEGVKEVRSSLTHDVTATLGRMDGKLDRVLAQVKAQGAVLASGAGHANGAGVASHGLTPAAQALVVPGQGNDDEGEAGAGEDGQGSGHTGSKPTASPLTIAELLKHLTTVLNTAGDMNKRLEDKNSKIAELRKALSSARRDHEEALDTVDKLTATRAGLFREATLARAEKTALEEACKELREALEAAQARIKEGEGAVASAQMDTRRAYGEAAQAMEQAQAARQEVHAAVARVNVIASERDSALARIASLEAALQSAREDKQAALASAARDLASAKAEAEARLKASAAEAEGELFALVTRMEAEEADHVTQARQQGYEEGYRAGLAAAGAGAVVVPQVVPAASEAVPSAVVAPASSEAPPAQLNARTEAAAAVAAPVPEALPAVVAPIAQHPALVEDEAAVQQPVAPHTEDSTRQEDVVDAPVTPVPVAVEAVPARPSPPSAGDDTHKDVSQQMPQHHISSSGPDTAPIALPVAAGVEMGSHAGAVEFHTDDVPGQRAEVQPVAVEQTPPMPPSAPARPDATAIHEIALIDLYTIIRPEFANRAKTRELFGQLGPVIWPKLGAKYGLHVVAPIAVQHGVDGLLEEVGPADGQHQALLQECAALRAQQQASEAQTVQDVVEAVVHTAVGPPVTVGSFGTTEQPSESIALPTAAPDAPVLPHEDVTATAVAQPDTTPVVEEDDTGGPQYDRHSPPEEQGPADDLPAAVGAGGHGDTALGSTAEHAEPEPVPHFRGFADIAAEAGPISSNGTVTSTLPSLFDGGASLAALLAPEPVGSGPAMGTSQWDAPAPAPAQQSSGSLFGQAGTGATSSSLFGGSTGLFGNADEDDEALPARGRDGGAGAAPAQPRSTLSSLFGPPAAEDEDEEEEEDVFSSMRAKPSAPNGRGGISGSSLFGTPSTAAGGGAGARMAALFGPSADEDEDAAPPPAPDAEE